MRLRSHDLPSVAPRKATATVRCPSCGSATEAGANFCTQCGTALGATDVTAVLERDAVRSRVAAGQGAAGEPETRVTGAAPAAAAADAAVDAADDAADVAGEDDPTDPGHDDGVADPRHAGDDLRRCPICRAANSPRRLLCGRCGADLDTGEPAQRRPREAFTAASAGDRPDRRGVGGVILAIVTAGVLIGGGLGAMVALGVGPFAEDAGGPPPAVFDDDRYAGAPQDLPAPAVGASTTHEPVADRSFDAQLMVDGDVTTAWNNSGRDTPMGVGDELRVEFDEPVWLTGIVLANGDQRDDDRYLGNARVQRARVVLDAGVSFTVTFLDQQGRQAVRLDVPELTTGLRIEILEAYPGDTYEDLAISELGLRGYRADAEDAELARRRAQFPRVVPTDR